ncbi:MAG: transposase [bacterium]|nr:transposase [bacterium]
MRKIRIAPGEHYHIFNRAVNKQTIFHDKMDWARFLFLILYFQSPKTFLNIGRPVKEFVKHSVFNTSDEEVVKNRTVELVAFCIMSNHFHLILKEVEQGGIAAYMQRVLNAYSKYYNTKYKKSGHVFQGPYQAVHIESDTQLLYLSAYIHRNPRETSQWFKKEDKYPWSSYQDMIGENRWGNLLVPDVLMGEFRNKKEYGKFVKTSPAKMFEEELAYIHSL